MLFGQLIICSFRFIAGTVAFKILLQIIACDHFGFPAALGKDHPDLFAVAGFSLQRKGRAGTVTPVAFIQVDHAALHDLADIVFAYLPAVHAAQGMFCKNKVIGLPVKCLPPGRLLPAEQDKDDKKHQYDS